MERSLGGVLWKVELGKLDRILFLTHRQGTDRSVTVLTVDFNFSLDLDQSEVIVFLFFSFVSNCISTKTFIAIWNLFCAVVYILELINEIYFLTLCLHYITDHSNVCLYSVL